MSILKILQYGHPLLRQKARDVKKVTSREREIIQAMGETMYHAQGVGLAGPQVGLMDRIFVLDVDQNRDEDTDAEILESRRLQVFINPEIVWESDDDSPFEEGCLSIPSLNREIYRPTEVKVVARDENFEEFEVDADEFLARVIQHELDHLDGVLFIDHLNRINRALVGGELNRIKKTTQSELAASPNEQYPLYI